MSVAVLEKGVNDPNNDAGGVDLYASYTYQDALDDVHTRFILNVPESELKTADRMFVQIEQAWWFYEDFICDPNPNTTLPRYGHLKPFAKELFIYSEVLPDICQFDEMWQEYSRYKKKISNYGCILLSPDCKRMVLCQVYNGKSFTLPSGKINQGEDGAAAAARETYEETGFDPSCKNGLTSEWKTAKPSKITWNTDFSAKDKLVFQEDDNGKRRTCYVIFGVPEDFPFAPVCRKEVDNIIWCDLDNLPPTTFGVLPFMKSLRVWINKKLNIIPNYNNTNARDSSNPKNRNNRSRERNKVSTPQRKNNSRTRVIQREDDDVVATGLAQKGDKSGWSEEEMFRVNEKLLGRKIDYDGNPHVFAEEGLSKTDPHAFRIVGGSFLNSQNKASGNATITGCIDPLIPPPDRSRLQPLFRSDTLDSSATTVDGFTPFFSPDGATPWGEIVPECVEQRKKPKKQVHSKSKREKAREAATLCDVTVENEGIDILPTDAQITARSHATKLASSTSKLASLLSKLQLQYESDMEYIRQWVANLPKPDPTSRFGGFTLDADAIMAQAEIDVPALRKT